MVTPSRSCFAAAIATLFGASATFGQYACTIVDQSSVEPTTTGCGGVADHVLGAPDACWAQFYAEGTDLGFVTVELCSLAYNVEGDDIIVHLMDWAPIAEPQEHFTVYASMDNLTYHRIGHGNSLPPSCVEGNPCQLAFELTDLDTSDPLPWAQFIKIQNDNNDGTAHVGPEIDAIQAVTTNVPTISEWGLAVMTLLILTAGTLVYARRRVALRIAG